MRNQNQFDHMPLNVDELFRESTDVRKVRPYPKWRRLLQRYTVALLMIVGLYSRLVDAGFVRAWFREFQEYWLEIHNGRPLYLSDFFFLLGIYRQRFQSVETPNNATSQEFLRSWQGPESWYQLFGAVRRFSHEPLHCYHFEKWINKGDRVLEYGCGLAPVAYSLSRCGRVADLAIDIADIKQINSHFARWRLGSQVKFIEIELYQNPISGKTYDVILLITVMEHLPNSLETVGHLLDSLEPGGVLIFDYISSDGDGQDTMESIESREAVLNLIEKRTTIVHGSIEYTQSMGLTVVRRN
jgi:2-polyprenyl-3-methyl-5-hydroxy-6-metoxy-1,4-benzoquinol methylase